MGRKARRRLRRLDHELARLHPSLDQRALIERGEVIVDGRVVTNPASLVRRGASIVVRSTRTLRGEAKLLGALDLFGVIVRGRCALDVGAAAGGFTRALLARGAARVYAVDAGFGQLLGSLRQDDRVVNLEGVNVASLTRSLVPEQVDVVTIDLSYLAVARAVHQLRALEFAAGADLIALVKPMFELRRGLPPTDPAELAEAVRRAQAGLASAGWMLPRWIESPQRGRGGSIEFFVHGRRYARFPAAQETRYPGGLRPGE